MKVLISEDDKISQKLLQATLNKKGFEVIVTSNGQDAWGILQRPDTPQLAVLDWMMPVEDGIEVIRKLRSLKRDRYVYAILLTAKCQQDDIATGLEAGADDYLIKPFNPKELFARVNVGVRMIELHNKLHDHVLKLEYALNQVKQLQKIVPICSYCKKVRNDDNYWQQVEAYVSEFTEARFSHSICPACYENVVLPELDKLDKDRRKS